MMQWTCPRLFPWTISNLNFFFSGMPGVLWSDILAPPTWGTKDYLINPWFLNIYLSFLLFLQSCLQKETLLFSLWCEHDETPGADWLASCNPQNLMNGGALNVVCTFCLRSRPVERNVVRYWYVRWWEDGMLGPSDWVTEWPSERLTEWPSDWVTEWLNDWMTEWSNDQMTGWQDDRKLCRRLTVWYILVKLQNIFILTS